MGRSIENEVKYYYDFHPTEEDEMSETAIHAALVHYLRLVLQWLFRGQACAIYDNLNFYQTANLKEYPVAPDLAVIKGADYDYVRSWWVGTSGPAPQVVFEIASEQTWEKDLREKPAKYATMGVNEYFAYDPNEPRAWRSEPRRLLGWRLEPETRQYRELIPNEDGWLWSQELESWLVPEDLYLRLFDRHHQQRLTGEEAYARWVEISEQRAEINKQRAEVSERKAKVSEQRAEISERKAKALAEKLRELGVNPDELEL